MSPESKELWGFLKAIEANPGDTQLRLVFADWLDEHDEPDEAAAQRAFDPEKHEAERWVRAFCAKYGADYDELLAAVKAGEGYCFGDDDGPYEAREGQLLEKAALLIGQPVDTDQYFRCAC